MITHNIRRKWHALIMKLFKQHFTDEMTDILHPDFGSYWQDGGEGDKYIKQAIQEQDKQLFNTQNRCDLLRDALYGLVYDMDKASNQNYSSGTCEARDEAKKILAITEK